MKRVTLIGANGFVGSAFARLLQSYPDIQLCCVTRENFDACKNTPSDVVIEAACNSKKYLADNNPLAEFEASVTHRLKTLLLFPAALHVHISSVDVYSDLTSPATTGENSIIESKKISRYGFHKLLAEELVRCYAPRWLILRLAGMIGPGLRKNPVFDILEGQSLRVHPDSRYQYMPTDEVAYIVWSLVEKEVTGEVYNVCGDGCITLREIAQIAGRELNLFALPNDASPRIVEANNEKIKKLFPVSKTVESLREFIRTVKLKIH